MARVNTREKLVDAALREFHALGFNAAGVKDITDSAGVPKGSFYNHFKTKESLAVVVLDRYSKNQRLERLSDSAVGGLERLRDHFALMQRDFIAHDYTRGCLFGDFGVEIVDHNEAIREAVRDGFNAWSKAVAEAIAAAQDDGSVRQDLEPDATARFLINAWEGALIQARAEKSAAAFDNFFAFGFGAILQEAARPA